MTWVSQSLDHLGDRPLGRDHGQRLRGDGDGTATLLRSATAIRTGFQQLTGQMYPLRRSNDGLSDPTSNHAARLPWVAPFLVTDGGRSVVNVLHEDPGRQFPHVAARATADRTRSRSWRSPGRVWAGAPLKSWSWVRRRARWSRTSCRYAGCGRPTCLSAGPADQAS